MKHLSKAQQATKDGLVAKLNKAKQEVSNAIADVAALIDEKLSPAIEAYNEIVGAVEEFRDDVVGDMQAYYDGRSDNWRDGGAGSAYQEWIDNWEGLDITELEYDEQPDEPTMDHPDDLEALDNEVQ